MYMHDWGGVGNYGYAGGMGPGGWFLAGLALAAPFILLLVFWSIFWKGLALWHSGRRGQYWWFVIMLVVNTLGILEIIYLFAVAKLKISELFSTHAPHEHH